MLLSWKDALAKSPLYLNLGGGRNAHPREHYEQYIAVDRDEEDLEVWNLVHDLTKPFPLPDACVDRIHTEDFLEHIPIECIPPLLTECYRLLKPGSVMRIGVPDYQSLKDRFCLKLGHDPRHKSHLTLTNYKVMKDLIGQTPFKTGKFYHYWDGDRYVKNEIDYSLGMIKRTPDNDPRCSRKGMSRIVFGYLGDLMWKVRRGFSYSQDEFLSRKGHRMFSTSCVVDLTKPK